MNPAAGFFGTDGESSIEGEPQEFKIPHLRNLYQKVGMFGMPAVPFFRTGDNGTRAIRCAASASSTTAASTRSSASG